MGRMQASLARRFYTYKSSRVEMCYRGGRTRRRMAMSLMRSPILRLACPAVLGMALLLPRLPAPCCLGCGPRATAQPAPSGAAGCCHRANESPAKDARPGHKHQGHESNTSDQPQRCPPSGLSCNSPCCAKFAAAPLILQADTGAPARTPRANGSDTPPQSRSLDGIFHPPRA